METYLSDKPDDVYAQINYVSVLAQTGDKKRARHVLEPIIQEHPDNPTVLYLAASVELMDDKPAIAERYARTLLDMDARDENAYTLMARVKMAQRNYDGVLHYADEALAIEPENSEALNLKIFTESLLGRENVAATVEDALNLAPEDPYTIAQHAYSLLSQGKHREALERAKYALSLNPQNDMARYVMLECLKARNPVYKLYFKYTQAMSRLSGGAAYAVIFGLWLGVRALRGLANSNPGLAVFINPIIYVAVAAFVLSWVITPLMNFYLLTNPYGRLLLDRDDKVMAKSVGAALGIAILCGLGYLITDSEQLLLLAVLSAAMMIPLGSFLRPNDEKQKRNLLLFTVAIGVCGLIGIFLPNGTVLMVAAFGLLGYQFVLNAMVAREAGRTFGE